jgi:hypothetical protein
MAHETTAESAKRRLENSRRALMQNMVRQHGAAAGQAPGAGGTDDEPAGADAASAEAAAAAGAASEGVKGLWRTLRRTAKAWWRSHPAHLAVELGQPMLDRYAATHPLKLLAISAAVGGAVVLAKPWRLISVTGLLIAALRSTQVSGLMSSLLSPEAPDLGQAGHR